jgi:multicomponent Na+:H+ antiporter subunit F
VGTWAAFSQDTTVTYSLAALALISFLGSVSVARFRVPDSTALLPDGSRPAAADHEEETW